MTEKWGIQEAINRVCEAKTGSLVSNKITLEYLFKLLGKVDAWRYEIKEAIQMWPDSASDEEDEEEDEDKITCGTHLEDDYLDESMDGDHASALASAGLGTDEDYGDYGNDPY